jgi:hypothetical protein
MSEICQNSDVINDMFHETVGLVDR